jgi:Holliday junction DNA helicase RuvA
MIARLSGTVWSIGEDYVVIRTGGIGLQVYAAANVLGQLDGPGYAVELFTHLHVRETELTLYGFLTEDELALFRLLLSVSGVGPKVALAVLGTVSPEALRQAVVQEEPVILSRVPGIGTKTAKAIIFHLKDKIISTEAEAVPLLTDDDAEVIAALTALGFSLVEAQTALQNIAKDEDLPIEERVREALAFFATP